MSLKAKYQVYGDLPRGPAPSFLVQNRTGAAYDPGLFDSYKNPNGTAKIQVINGRIPPVLPEDL